MLVLVQCRILLLLPHMHNIMYRTIIVITHNNTSIKIEYYSKGQSNKKHQNKMV